MEGEHEHERNPGENRVDAEEIPEAAGVVAGRVDRAEHLAAFLLVAGQERQEHANAEVEAFEHEVAAPEDGDQAEPEDLEVHLSTSPPAPAALQACRAGQALRSGS